MLEQHDVAGGCTHTFEEKVTSSPLTLLSRIHSLDTHIYMYTTHVHVYTIVMTLWNKVDCKTLFNVTTIHAMNDNKQRRRHIFNTYPSSFLQLI
jgi:hypothetical protein